MVDKPISTSLHSTDLKERGIVVKDESSENVKELSEPFDVLQVLADVKQIKKLWDVVLLLERQRQLVTLRSETSADHEAIDVLEAAQLARRQLQGRHRLVGTVRGVAVFRIPSHGEAGIDTLNLHVCTCACTCTCMYMYEYSNRCPGWP